MSGIHILAYDKLIKYLGFDNLKSEVYDQIQQLANPHEQVLKKLEVDVRSIRPRSPKSFNLNIQQIGNYSEYIDEWGVRWRKPISGGLYYDMVFHPLEFAQSLADIEDYTWIDPFDNSRYSGLHATAVNYSKDGFGVVHWSIGPGVSEIHAWLRGYEKYYTDFYLHPEIAEYIMSKVVDIKIAYWEYVLSRTGKYIDVIVEADDLAGQNGPLFFHPLHVREQNIAVGKDPHIHRPGGRILPGDLAILVDQADLVAAIVGTCERFAECQSSSDAQGRIFRAGITKRQRKQSEQNHRPPGRKVAENPQNATHRTRRATTSSSKVSS